MPTNQHTALSSEVSRPSVLTIELVVTTFAHELKAAIRQFPNESLDDAYQAIVLHLVTPYESTGKTPLDGYNSLRGSAGAYLFEAARNVLLKRHLKAQRRENLAPMLAITRHASDSGDYDDLGDGSISEESVAAGAAQEVDIYSLSMSDIAHMLADTEHARVLRVSAAGEPVSTQRMLELFVFDDRSLTEIAAAMGVSQSDVRRRFARLKAEPWAQTLKANSSAS